TVPHRRRRRLATRGEALGGVLSPPTAGGEEADHGGFLRHHPVWRRGPRRGRRRLPQAREQGIAGRGRRVRRRAPPRRRAERQGLRARPPQRLPLRRRPPDCLCCSINCRYGNKIHQNKKGNASWNNCCRQCTCTDILHLQDIKWWQ
ncbi:Os03g0584300, partial [Oryza sativa Japonica Group]